MMTMNDDTTELNEAAMQDGDLRRMAIGIAGNKKDLEADREVSTKDATAYADSIGTHSLHFTLFQ